ncbi:MAG: hypothetical protein ACFFF4_10850 [Candidatus Thorarchaeota archaeon]
MTDKAETLLKKIRRRRNMYYAFGIFVSIALMIAGYLGWILQEGTEAGFNSIQSSVLLTFAMLLLVLVPTRDLRRIEAIIYLAEQRGGTLKVEEIRKNIGLPDDKAVSLLVWMQKKKMVEKVETTNRWIFPELRKKDE